MQVEILEAGFKAKNGKTAADLAGEGSVFIRSGGKLLTRPGDNPLKKGEVAIGTAATSQGATGRQAFDNFNSAAKGLLERFQDVRTNQLTQGTLSQQDLDMADAGIILEESPDDIKSFSPNAQNRIREAKRSGVKTEQGLLNTSIARQDARAQAFVETWGNFRDLMKDMYGDEPPQKVLDGYKTALESGTISIADVPPEDLRYVLPLVDVSKLPKNEEEIDIFTDVSGNRVRVVRDADGKIRTDILGKSDLPKTRGGGGGTGTAGERNSAKLAAINGDVMGVLNSQVNEGEANAGRGTFTTIAAYRQAQNKAIAAGVPLDEFNERYSGYLSPRDRATYGVGSTTNLGSTGLLDAPGTESGTFSAGQLVSGAKELINSGSPAQEIKEDLRQELLSLGYSNEAAQEVIESL